MKYTVAFIWLFAYQIAFGQDSLVFNLPGNLRFVFAKNGKFITGLQKVAYDKIALKSGGTINLPLVSDEWFANEIFPFMELQKTDYPTSTGGFALHLNLKGSRDLVLWKHFFAFGQNGNDPALFPKAEAILQAERNQMQWAATCDASLTGALKQLDSLKAIPANSSFRSRESREAKYKQALRNLIAKSKELIKARKCPLPDSLGGFDFVDHARRVQQADILKNPVLLRDMHSQAITEVPAICCSVANLQKMYKKPAKLFGGSSLIWHFEPVTDTIKGYPAQGWKEWVEVKLDGKRKTNTIRFYNTWEIGGSTDSLTAISMRYRGKGSIEENLSCPVKSAFSTCEIWPDGYKTNRIYTPKPEYGLSKARQAEFEDRLSCNLLGLAQGGGNPFFDFQVKKDLALLIIPEKMQNQRSVVETYAGDEVVSHTYTQCSAYGQALVSTPRLFLLIKEKNLGREAHKYRTLWLATDQWCRDRLSAQLNFVQKPALPTVGMNWDIFSPARSFAKAAENLGNFSQTLEKAGVKTVLNHTSGWESGQSHRAGGDGTDTAGYFGGGSCVVYDWKPMPKVGPAWKEMHLKLRKSGIDYIPWITAMTHEDGNFFKGLDKNKRCLNSPLEAVNNTYGNYMIKHNMLDPNFYRKFDAELESIRTEYGLEGYWLDSFHNLWQSEFDWASGTGMCMQMPNMTWLAEQSRKGLTLVSEGQMQPGLNCSIEVPNWERQPYYFNQTLKWLRNGEHKQYSKDELSNLSFRIMAAGGQLTFDILEYATDGPYLHPDSIVPIYSQLAKAHAIILPHLKNARFLPNEAGVIWTSGSQQVVFGFKGLTALPNKPTQILFQNGEDIIAFVE